VNDWYRSGNYRQVATDVQQLVELVAAKDRTGFERKLRTSRPEHLPRMWGYLSLLIVGIQKAADPVTDGYKLDVTDQAVISDACGHVANDKDTADQVYHLVVAATEKQFGVMVEHIMRWHEESWWHAVKCYWTLISVLIWMRDGSQIHSMFVVRAAVLRMQIITALELVKTHEWAEADLPVVADLAVMLDDKNMSPPGDDLV
jgi:hypothetical protein